MSRPDAPGPVAPTPRRRVIATALAVVVSHLLLFQADWHPSLDKGSHAVVWVTLDPTTPPSLRPIPSEVRAATGPSASAALPNGPPIPDLESPSPRGSSLEPDSPGAVTPKALPQQPVPHRISVPPPFTWAFTVHRAQSVSRAILQFDRGYSEGANYDLRWTETGAPEGSWAWHSRGAVSSEGLMPQRLVETRQGRDRRAINVDRDAGWVGASSTTHREPVPAGVQDRLSWVVQFSATVRAHQAVWRAGESLTLAVAQWDGRVVLWRFVLRSAGTGMPGLWIWERAPAQDYDAAIEVWMSPDAAFQPIRVVWRWPPHPQETRWEATN